MSKNIDIFCPECGSVLNISRTNNSKNIQNINEDNNYDQVIQKALIDGENIDIPENFNMELLLSNKNFINLPDNKKQNIINKIEKYLIADNSMLLYYHCKSCSWTKKILPGTKLLTKISAGDESSYINFEKYKNKIHSNILPFTRNYICTNKKCISNTELEKREAVMFRVNNSMKILYICRACEEIFEAQ